MVLENNVVLLPEQEGDIFLDEEKWDSVIKQMKQLFPGSDLIAYRIKDSYWTVVSVSESLNVESLIPKALSLGVIPVGSCKKVNLITQDEVSNLLSKVGLASE